MSLSRRLARPMLSVVFVAGGIDTLRNPGPRVKMSEDVGPPLAAKLGLPTDPELLVKLNAGVQVGAGLLLAAGRLRRLSALVLISSLVPTTYAGHRFWKAEEPGERARQQVHFYKNVGLMGGLLLALVDTDGAPSLGWWAARAARKAGTAIAVGAGGGGSEAAGLGRRAARRAATATAGVATGARIGRAAGEHALVVGSDRAKPVARAAAQAAKRAADRANTLAVAGASQSAGAWRQAAEHLPSR